MSFNRRDFIKGSAMSLAGITLSGIPMSTFGKEGKIRIGIIGCGQRGQGIASTIKNIKDMEVVCFCDISKTALEKVKKFAESNAKFYTDYHDLLVNRQVDAVIIATPLYLHYRMSVDTLDAKKHLYVEKTMTYNIQEALDLEKRMKNSNLVLQVGHQYRYYDMYHKIKEIVSQGWLGQVTHIESQYNMNNNWRRPVGSGEFERAVNWRMYKEYSGGIIAELCAHQIDVVNWLLDGHPKKVVGLGGVDFWKDGRETFDNIRTIYEYDNGVKSSVTSVLSNQHNSYAMRILGSKGTIEISRNKAYFSPEPSKVILGEVDGVTGATLEAVKSKGKTEIKYSSPDGLNQEPTAYSLMAFADCIKNGKKPFSDVHTGKDTAIAVHMGNAAVETGVTQYWNYG